MKKNKWKTQQKFGVFWNFGLFFIKTILGFGWISFCVNISHWRRVHRDAYAHTGMQMMVYL